GPGIRQNSGTKCRSRRRLKQSNNKTATLSTFCRSQATPSQGAHCKRQSKMRDRNSGNGKGSEKASKKVRNWRNVRKSTEKGRKCEGAEDALRRSFRPFLIDAAGAEHFRHAVFATDLAATAC